MDNLTAEFWSHRDAEPFSTDEEAEMAYRGDDAVFEKGERDNLRVVIPAHNELQIDLDGDAQYMHYQEMLKLFKAKGFKFTEQVNPSKSGLPNRHVTLTLTDSIDPWQRIALQASLGSDPKRELLSAARILNGDPYPTAFLELKEDNNGKSNNSTTYTSSDCDCLNTYA